MISGTVVVEVDISIRDGTIDGAGIDQVLAAANLDELDMDSSEPSAITYCTSVFVYIAEIMM